MDANGNPLETGPGTSGNPADGGPATPETPTSDAGTITTPETPDLTTLQREVQELKAHNERLLNNYNGSKAEAERVRAEAERLRSEAEAERKAFQDRLIAAVGGTVPGSAGTPTYRSEEEAMDAFLNNRDPNALTTFRRMQQEAVTREFTETQTRAAMAYQEAQRLQAQYPDLLKDGNSDGYREMWDAYQAAMQDPMTRFLYPEDQRLITNAYDPATKRTVPIDVRILQKVVLEKAAASGRAMGQQDEATRRQAPTLAGGDGVGRTNGGNTSQDAAVNATALLSVQERESIQEMLRRNAIPKGWANSVEGIAKQWVERWKKNEPGKYQERLKLHQSGQPIIEVAR